MDKRRGNPDAFDEDAPGKEESGKKQQEALPALRAFLIDRYSELRLRLARRLGSSDWAEDALQDTYLRLDGTEALGEIRNPGAYLFRAAFHIALNQRRAENRRLSAGEVESLLHIADDAPDALRIVEGRTDIARLKRVMAELPPRPRAILLAARLDGLSRQQIAERFGISVSMVEKELRRAQEYCAARFGRNRKTT
jgi:RNA polymerase sigma-70 factor (ECF subfamily)